MSDVKLDSVLYLDDVVGTYAKEKEAISGLPSSASMRRLWPARRTRSIPAQSLS